MRIAVIGAGPAGSRAAGNLARAGHEVDLYDASFDREKPCGGGIPWRGLALVSILTRGSERSNGGGSTFAAPTTTRRAVARKGPTDDGRAVGGAGPNVDGRAVRSVAVRRVRFEAPSGAAAEVPLGRPVAVYSRRELDRALAAEAERAGARLVERRVVGLERAGTAWRLTLAPPETSPATASLVGSSPAGATDAPGLLPMDPVGAATSYDHIVGADGVKSFVRRAVGGAPFASADLSQAVGWYVPGPPTDTMTIRFDARIAGYLWAFPRADHVAIGACAPLVPGAAERLWAVARDFLESARRDDGSRRPAGESYSALIPSLGPAALEAIRPCGPGWSLVGDAAGLVDPLTREGIAHGIRSADLLAEAFDREAPASYERRVRDTLLPELIWAAARRERFFEPALVERLVRYLGRSSAIRAVMADLIAGEQDYRTLKRRLVRSALPAGLQLTLAKLRPRAAAHARSTA